MNSDKMTRKFNNHIPHTNPLQQEEETQNTDRPLRARNMLSLPQHDDWKTQTNFIIK